MVGVAVLLTVMVGCTSDDAAFRRVTRSDPSLAWVGERVFVYGGSPDGEWETPPLGDASLWNPESEEYESVAEPPFELPLKPGAAAVAVGDAVVLLGTLCETPLVLPDNASYSCPPGSVAAATYDLSEDSWLLHELPASLAGFADAYVEAIGATSDGRAVFFVSAGGERLWAVDAEGAWEALAPLPIEAIRHRGPICMAGDTVVALTKVTDRRELRVHLLPLDAPGASWTPSTAVGPPDGDNEVRGQLACGEDFVLVVGGTAYDPARRHPTDVAATGEGWTTVSPAPVDLDLLVPVWTGDELIFLADPFGESPGSGTAYDPQGDRWRTVHADPIPTSVIMIAGTPDRPAVVGWPPRGATEPFSSEIRG